MWYPTKQGIKKKKNSRADDILFVQNVVKFVYCSIPRDRAYHVFNQCDKVRKTIEALTLILVPCSLSKQAGMTQ